MPCIYKTPPLFSPRLSYVYDSHSGPSHQKKSVEYYILHAHHLESGLIQRKNVYRKLIRVQMKKILSFDYKKRVVYNT